MASKAILKKDKFRTYPYNEIASVNTNTEKAR